MADETRVVQMQFDNKNFERNIAKSQSSLDRFKKSLNFDAVGKGLSKFSDGVKNLAFDTLNNNIQKLTDKFTGLGNASEYVLSRIRASLEGLAMQAEQFVKSLTMEQVQVGQNKYDALTKSVQTIVASGSASEERAYSVMERVMEYTNQTSHSFETMVAQISSLTSIGVPLSKAEKMMEAFANASTKAGADASHAAIAMQTYSKAMGSYLTKNEFDTLNLTAKVVTKEWREQMIEAGLAAGDLVKDAKGVIKTAKKYGKQVTVTADTIENTLNKKWATRKTLSAFTEKYMFGDSIEELKHPEDAVDSFGKAAYLTGQRALTFADALNAVKEAVSGGWMSTFRIIFGDLTDAMNLWTGSCNKVIDALSGLSEARNAVLNIWKELGGRDSILKLIFGEMEDTDGNTMYEGAYGIIDIFTDVGNMISEAFYNTFKNLIPRNQQQAILDIVNANFKQLGFDKPFETFDELWNDEKFIESGGRTSFMGGALQGITDDIQKFVQSVNDWFNEIDPATGLSRMQKIQNVLDAIGRTIAFVLEIGAGIAHFFEVLGDSEHLGPSLQILENLLSALGLTVTETENDISNANGINTFFENLAEVLKPACELINLVVGSLADLIGAMIIGEQENNNFGKVITKIGDVIKKVVGFLTTVATPIATFISEVSGILGDLFKDGFSEAGMAKAKERFSTALTKLWEGLKTAFAPFMEKLGAFLSMLWSEIKARVAAYFDDPNSLGHKILEPIKTALGPVWDFLKSAWEQIRNVFFSNGNIPGPTLFDSLKILFMSEGTQKLFAKLRELSKNGGLYKLIVGAVGVYSLLRAAKAFKYMADFFSDVGGNLKQGFLGKSEWFSEQFLNTAKSIALIAASVAVLGAMKTESVIQGVIALGAIMAEFYIFFKMMNSNKAGYIQQTAITGALSLFAGAIAILVASLLPFALVDWGGFARMIAGLGLVMLELVGFMALTSALKLKTRSLGTFIGFAISMQLLVSSLIPLMIAPWESMLRAIVGLGLVMLELVGFMVLVSHLKVKTSSLGSFIGFAVAMGILLYSLVPFMVADWQSMLRGIVGLGLVMTELIGFMVLVSSLKIKTSMMGSFIGFAVAMGILMLSLIPFMSTNWEGMLKAVVGLGIVLLELVGFMELMKTLSLGTSGLNLAGCIGFAISIAILMLSLKPLAEMSWEQLARAVVGLGVILLELVGFMELMKVLNISSSALDMAGILGFVLSIAVLVLAMKSWAYMDWEQWARAVAGLAVVFGLLLAFMAIVSAIPANAANIGMAIALCLGISAMAVLMSIAMNEVRNLKWEVITAFTTGLAAVMLAMAGAIVILSAVPFSAGIKGIALLAVAIGAIVGVIALIGPMLIDSIGDSFARLSGKLELISGLLKGFSDRMGQIDEGNITKAEGLFDKLKQMLGKLSGWGKFTGDLNNFSYAMFVLGTGMEIFNNHVGNVVGDLGNNADAALEFLQKLSGCANDLDTISKLNLDNLIVAITGLGGAMSIYAYGAKEIQGFLAPGESPDETTVGAAIAILQAISKGLVEAGGFTIPENMPDEQAIGLFGAQLAALAGALTMFEEAGKGLGSGTDKALETLDFFQRLKDRLISTEFSKNLWAVIGVFDRENVDKQELAEFGANIEQLGYALKTFYDSVTILDEASGERTPVDFSNAVTTLDSLVELEGKLGWDFGPLIQFFAGRNKDFTDLAGEIEALGTGLSDFIDKVGGVDEKGNPKMDTKLFDQAIEAADKIAEYLLLLESKMDHVGGIWPGIQSAWGGRDFNFTDLKQQLQDLAAGLGSLGQLKYDKKLITVDDTKGIFAMVDSIIKYMQKLDEDLGNVGGIWNTVATFVIGRDYNFTDLKQQLVALSEGLTSLTSFEIENIPTAEQMETAFPTIDAIIEYMKSLKKKLSGGNGTVGGIWNTLKHIVIGRDFDLTDLGKQLQGIGDGLASLAGINMNENGGEIFTLEGRGAALDTIDAMIKYMTSLKDSLGKVGGIAKFFDNLWNGTDADFEYVGTQLGYLGDGLGKFQNGLVKEGSFDVNTVEQSLASVEHLVTILKTMNDMSDDLQEMTNGGDKWKKPYKMYHTEEFVTELVHLLDNMNNGVDGLPSVTASLANFIRDFNALSEDFGDLSSAAELATKITNVILDLVTATKIAQNEDGVALDFSIIGSSIAAGVAQGIANGTSSVIDAAVTMATKAYEAAKAALGINSPSRVFADMGINLGLGLISGINSQEDSVGTASEGLANDAVNGAKDAMATFASLMSQEIDANPTITPVLDLSNVTAGAGIIDGLLSGEKDLSLAGAGGDYSSTTVPKGDHGTSEYRGQDLTWINTAIQQLGSRVDSLGTKISNMQIVLNTGALVGGVTDGVNQNLGEKTIFARRRN